MNKIRVLYIDDEPFNIFSFKASFRNEFEIITAGNGNEAIDILKKEVIHIVLSDQRMPGMTGVELFEKMLRDFPDPIRILVTAYADIEAIINAVNKGKIFHYLSKPWNEAEIYSIIRCAYESYLMKEENNKMVNGLMVIKNQVDQFMFANKIIN